MGDRKREELREEDTEVEKPDAGKLWLYRHHEAAGELAHQYSDLAESICKMID
ncbi:hypothetical protein Bca4012_043687 [Brassica carinata]